MTPFGCAFKTELGWAAVRFNERDEITGFLLPSSTQKSHDFLAWTEHKHFPQLEKAVVGYFAGKKIDFCKFSVSLADASPFFQKVYEALRTVKYGDTVTYKDLAKKAGNPSAVRAVGSAMAHNPIPLIIPCHRVIQSDGGLGGFSAVGGVELKKMMIDMEHPPTSPAANKKQAS